MEITFYQFCITTQKIAIHLYSCWRASQLEHKLFDSARTIVGKEPDRKDDSLVLTITAESTWNQLFQNWVRILKGWEEDAVPGDERRRWRWVIEGDTDHYGYNHNGDNFALWVFLRTSIEHGEANAAESIDEFDLDALGIQLVPNKTGQL